MQNVIISFSIAFFSAIAPWMAFADEVDMVKAVQIIKKYNTTYERPKSCPLESKKFVDLVTKMDAIRDALKGNCLKVEANKMNEISASFKLLQDNLKSNAVVSNSELLSGMFQDKRENKNVVSGQQISSVLSNINSIITNGQCNMDDGSIMQSTADLIYGTTQLGFLSGSPTGLVVAGGGFIISSALRLIDLIIKHRFDFDRPVDRNSFIKLNCSFYDIRKDLETQGILDLENSTTREDFRDTKTLADEITLALKKNEDEKANINIANAEIDHAIVMESIGDLVELKKALSKVQKYLQPGLNQSLEIPTETQKLLMISQLAQDYNLLATQVRAYKELNVSSIPFLDDLFIMELRKFDPIDIANFTESLNISARDFNDNYRAKILFHIIRIGQDIELKEQKVLSKGDKQKLELINGLEQKNTDYLVVLNDLRRIETRLGNIVSPSQYSGMDDGSDNMVAIIDNHNKISSQLYGKLGEKFLKFATERSLERITIFNDRLVAFNNKYTSIIKLNKIDKTQTSYSCQDAQKLRLMLKYADSIVQEGFDFVVTNKDLIYSDVSDAYKRTLNEEEDFVSGGAPVKVQRHYKSALYALKKLKGEVVSAEDNKRYLQKTFFGNYFIGKSMIEVSNSKLHTKIIQDIYDKFECQRSLAADIEM